MRVLCLTTVVPYPLEAGGRVRMAGFLRALCTDHDVHLVVVAEPEEQDPDLSSHLGIRVTVHRIDAAPVRSSLLNKLSRWLRAVTTGIPAWCQPACPAEIRKRLTELPRDFDRLVVLDDRAGVFLRYLPSRPATVVDLQFVRGSGRAEPNRRTSARLLAAVDQRIVRRFLRRLLRQSDCVVVTSGDEADELEHLYGRRPEAVVPSAVDIAREAAALGSDGAVLWIGDMGWHPNVQGLRLFLRDAWPRLASSGARLLIAGRQAPADIERLADSAQSVHLLGFVPELAPVFDQVAVSVAPVWSGGGVRLKTLTMLGAGSPLVATAAAVEGIDAEPGRHFVHAESPSDFATAVQALLDDPGERRRLGTEGRELVRRRYTWEAIGPQFVAAVQDARSRPA